MNAPSEKPISGARVARELLGRSPSWFYVHRAELEAAGFPKPVPILEAYYPPSVRAAVSEMGLSVDLSSPDCYEIDTAPPPSTKAPPSNQPFGDWDGVPGVYLAGFADFIKIGVSDSVGFRLRAIQGNLPVALTLYGVIVGAELSDERDLHHRFAAHRLRLEWFTLSPEIVAYIEGGKRRPQP